MFKNRKYHKQVYQTYRSRYSKASKIAEVIETLLLLVAILTFSNTTSGWLVLLNWVILPIFTIVTFVLAILDYRGRLANAKREDFIESHD